jgi:hypothetical protein
MRRPTALALLGLAAAFGVSAAWIPVKAQVAQVLLHRAFYLDGASINTETQLRSHPHYHEVLSEVSRVMAQPLFESAGVGVRQ